MRWPTAWRDCPSPSPSGEATVAPKITREDLHLDWHGTAEQLGHVVRLGHAWTTFRGRHLTVLQASVDGQGGLRGRGHARDARGIPVATGAGALVLQRVQPESRSPMSADDWIRGAHLVSGERLGTD